ncbi:MAG TPA: peptidylprolyl isomerase [Longimicrobiales bacterium]
MTARRRRPAAFVACVALAAALGACAHQPDRRFPLQPRASFWSSAAPDSFRVRIETTRGPFELEAYRAWAPHGVDHFWQLVRAGYFDDSRFFRVVPDFIVQFGIAGDPALAALWRQRAIPDDPVRRSNTRRLVSYAMTGPDTRTTQLFINLRDNARLDTQGFAPIGMIVRGMNVVDQLYSGYGETSGGGVRAARQDSLFLGGNSYLDRAYPRLDRIIRAQVVR